MTRRGRAGVWIAITIAIAASLTVGLLTRRRPKALRPLILEGAVISRASQPDKESPLSHVEVTATEGLVTTSGASDSSGFFKLALPISRQVAGPILLSFRHPGYLPLELGAGGERRLYVAKMAPTPQRRRSSLRRPQVTVTNISVRYAVKATAAVNVGSLVKTFQVENTGSAPCRHDGPCSPDGKWKAAIGSVSLDAGKGNVFRNARASCIAGPCPFTKITAQNFRHGARTFRVKAYDWSDTATFLVEAEIFHPMESNDVHKSYPVIFGRVLHFALPASSEGVCIEAELGGAAIVFPLGPDPDLPWAECHESLNPDKSRVYRCELDPGYRF
ncbi:MAG: carboxypeptidase regulatory-like domain-containing protein [Terriglobia bacterium]